MKRRQLVLGGIGATLLTPVLWTQIETELLITENLQVPVQGLDRVIKIAQLSDLHWDDGMTAPWTLIAEAIARINQANVDLVALTGDFVTRAIAPIERLAPALGRIKSRLGIYAVLGNHDNVLWDSRRKITQALQREQITVLENQWTTVDGIALAGVGDLWFGPHEPEQIFSTLRGRKPTVLLAHNPDTFWPLENERIDLQLSGHTHGGQVRFGPLGTPLGWRRLIQLVHSNVPEGIRLPYTGLLKSDSWAGLYHQGINQLYVSRGIGRFRGLSLGCPPEVTFIDLIPAD